MSAKVLWCLNYHSIPQHSDDPLITQRLVQFLLQLRAWGNVTSVSRRSRDLPGPPGTFQHRDGSIGVQSESRDDVALTALPDVAVSGFHEATLATLATLATPHNTGNGDFKNVMCIVLLHFRVKKSISLGSLLEAYSRLQERAWPAKHLAMCRQHLKDGWHSGYSESLSHSESLDLSASTCGKPFEPSYGSGTLAWHTIEPAPGTCATQTGCGKVAMALWSTARGPQKC